MGHHSKLQVFSPTRSVYEPRYTHMRALWDECIVRMALPFSHCLFRHQLRLQTFRPPATLDCGSKPRTVHFTTRKRTQVLGLKWQTFQMANVYQAWVRR